MSVLDCAGMAAFPWLDAALTPSPRDGLVDEDGFSSSLILMMFRKRNYVSGKFFDKVNLMRLTTSVRFVVRIGAI